MAKNYIFNRRFVWLVILLSAAFFNSCIKLTDDQIKRELRSNFQPPKIVVAPVKSDREKLVEAYTSLNGIKEKTGNNDGQQVEYILKSVGLAKGNPWCAATCYYGHQKAGFGDRVPKLGYSPTWFPKANSIYIKGSKGKFEDMQQGDVVGYFIPEKGRIGHVGFMHDPNTDKNTCTTFEGNYGNKAGFVKRMKTAIKKADMPESELKECIAEWFGTPMTSEEHLETVIGRLTIEQMEEVKQHLTAPVTV